MAGESRQLKRSLKVRIVAYFLATVGLVSLASLGLLYLGGSRVLEAWMLRSNRYLAKAVRRHLDQGLARGARNASVLASRLALLPEDSKERSRLMQSFLEFGELFSNAYLFRADGSLEIFEYRGGTKPAPERLGENYHSYPGPFPATADAVLASGKPAFTPIFLTTSGRPQMTYVLPVQRPGDGRGSVLSLALYAVSEQVNGWIADLQPGSHGYIAVLDAAGRAVAVSGQAPSGLTSRGVDVLGQIGGESSAVVTIDGREDLVIREGVTSAELQVLIGLPRSIAYRPLQDLRTPALLSLLAAVLLALAGAFRLARRILPPVDALIGGIRRVGDGVLSHRVAVEGDDELAEAARAFNGMADRLHRERLVEEVWKDIRGR